MHFALPWLAVAFCATRASAAGPPRHVRTHGVVGFQADPSTPPQSGNGTFTQLIDHDDPSVGTFEQFYYWSTEFWGGPGYPVVFNTPGESNVSGYQSYLGVERTTGVLAKEMQAAVVVVEHRYWGYSSPYPDLTTKNLQYLTLNQSISDFTTLAEQLRPEWDPEGASRASKAPWVFVGGSYPGALAAWTASTQPGTFWAYYAASAPVQAVDDFWEYFSPVQLGMPKNCSTDVALVIDHVDSTLANGTSEEKQALKDMFGLSGIEYDDDFGESLEPGPWLWQSNQFYTGYSGFFQFCDLVENVDQGEMPDENGVGLQKALAGYARFINPSGGAGCTSNCFNSRDASSSTYTDTSLSNEVDRQWTWLLCNEPLGYWQDGAPQGQPSLVSRTVDAEHWRRECSLYFPEEDGFTVGIAQGASENTINSETQGWDYKASRLLYVNGEFDPWRSAGVSSDYRAGGPMESTPDTPIVVVPGGFHCSDLVTENGVVNAGAQQAIDTIVTTLVNWVNEHPSRQNATRY